MLDMQLLSHLIYVLRDCVVILDISPNDEDEALMSQKQSQ